MKRACLPALAMATLLSASCVTGVGAADPPRLIVRGDDMGFSHAGNLAIRKCYTEGVESSVEVLVPSPWFPEAAAMLAGDGKVDVGVHLTLSSEWDNVKWRPVTDCPSLRDDDGYFYPMIRPNKNYPGRALSEKRWRLVEVEKEFRAQIELAKKKIPRVSHVSGHMGCDGLGPEVTALVASLSKEYGLVAPLGELGVKGVGYGGPHKTPEEKVASFLKTLDGLEAGRTYLFVDHPGLDSPELRAIHHVGYEDVAADRQGVTDAWTDPRVRKRIEERGIRLVGYRDLRAATAAEKAGAAPPQSRGARWEKEIRAFEEADKAEPPPKGAALFTGSSTIRLWKTLADDFPGHKVINRGFGGSQIADVTYFADRIIVPYEPKQVFLRAGGNDVHGGKLPGEVAADFAEFVRVVHGRLPDAEIVYVAVSPAPSRWGENDKYVALNKAIREMAVNMSRVSFVDSYDVSLTPDGRGRPELFVADRLHFNADGYKLLAEHVRPYLNAAK